MATAAPAAAPPRKWIQIPRPLQKLFDTFPLLAYDVNALPARAQSATSGDLPTLYVFSSEEDALLGAPSFNPSCLKWQVRSSKVSLGWSSGDKSNRAPTSNRPSLSLPASSSKSYPRQIMPHPPAHSRLFFQKDRLLLMPHHQSQLPNFTTTPSNSAPPTRQRFQP